MSRNGVRLAVAADGAPALVQYFSLCGVWAVTLYDACDQRCSYCITFAQGTSTPRVIEGVAAQVAREIESLPDDAILGLGALVDAYPHAEAEHRVARAALVPLVESGRRIVVVTKGTTIERDVDLLCADNVEVSVSLTSLDDEILRGIEPHVAPASARMRTVETLYEAGVDVQVRAQPWIPGITDAEAFLDWAADRFPVSFTPLSVQSPAVTAFRDFDQHELNAAYLAEGDRLGRRRGMRWERPLWIGTAPRPGDGEHRDDGHDDVELRNLRTIDRMLAALSEGSALELLHEFWSPYLRTQGPASRGDDGGRAEDLLFLAHAALADPVAEVVECTADGSWVHVILDIEGVHRLPVLGIEPTGARLALRLDLRFGFDTHGLVLDIDQSAAVRETAPSS